MTPEEYNELLGLITDFISKNGKELKQKWTTSFPVYIQEPVEEITVRKGVIRNYEFDEELHKKAKEETQQYMEYLKNQEHLERCLKLWN